jgi:short subunit dehydrogenase-like uncharacterized protein
MTVERQVQYWFQPRAHREFHLPSACPIHLWESPKGKYFYGFPDFGDGVKSAVTIPWGDVCTAYFTTGIANIETYVAMPAKQIAALRRLNWIGALLKLSLVQSLLKRQATKGPPGPDEDTRRRNPMYVWGEVQAPSGEAVTARIKVANGYDVTVHAALGVLQHLLEYTGPGGYRTPTQLVGSQFVESLPGSGRMEIVRGRAWEPRPPA